MKEVERPFRLHPYSSITWTLLVCVCMYKASGPMMPCYHVSQLRWLVAGFFLGFVVGRVLLGHVSFKQHTFSPANYYCTSASNSCLLRVWYRRPIWGCSNMRCSFTPLQNELSLCCVSTGWMSLKLNVWLLISHTVQGFLQFFFLNKKLLDCCMLTVNIIKQDSTMTHSKNYELMFHSEL
jgi:hypothetical protein